MHILYIVYIDSNQPTRIISNLVVRQDRIGTRRLDGTVPTFLRRRALRRASQGSSQGSSPRSSPRLFRAQLMYVCIYIYILFVIGLISSYIRGYTSTKKDQKTNHWK